MKKILLLVSLAFVSLLVCANPEDDRGVPMRAQGACPPVHACKMWQKIGGPYYKQIYLDFMESIFL
jgi:hypothetical protein